MTSFRIKNLDMETSMVSEQNTKQNYPHLN